MRFYHEDNSRSIQHKKWVKYNKDVVIDKKESKVIIFKINSSRSYVIKLEGRDRDEYDKEKHEEYLFNQLPLVEQLRRKGNDELINYVLIMEEHIYEKDVYSEGEDNHRQEFDVIVGNRCKSYYYPDQLTFTIEEIIDDKTVLINKKRIIEGNIYPYEKSMGGYTNDGPRYWTIKLNFSLNTNSGAPNANVPNLSNETAWNFL